MATSLFELSAIEYAQHLQVGLMEGAVEQRLELAQEALRLLDSEVTKLQAEGGAKFLVDSNYAIDRPLQEKPAAQQNLIIFGQLAVEGKFLDFSYVQIGKLLTANTSVNSLCLSLEDVSMVPGGELLPEGDVLHLPVLAITQSIRAA